MKRRFIVCCFVLAIACRPLLAGDCEPGTGTPVWTIDQVASLASRAWSCQDLAEAIALAHAESQFRPYCVSTNTDGSQDTGLWQINDLRKNLFFWLGMGPQNQRNPQAHTCGLDPTCNLTYTHRLWQYGGIGKPQAFAFTQDIWHAFGDDDYNTYLPVASAFVNSHPNLCQSSCTVVNGQTVCPPSPPASNVTNRSIESITSGDPNDKVGSQGVGVQGYTAGGTPLRYAILFSNLETATAPAQDVIITDQLDPLVDDLTTLAFGSVTFGSQLLSQAPGTTTFTTTSDLRPTNNLLVQVHAHLNVFTGLLTWRFTSLDPTTHQPPADPTAGFLPPGGEGSVFFTVMPKQNLATDTQIQNQATIVFDVNPPMSTQTWLNTLDNTPPASRVAPLPSSMSTPSFNVSWSGADVGSGVHDFTIFVSDNQGPFVPFLTNTSGSSATFSGQVGHTYAFYSIARDLVGNVEAAKSAAEATTQVVTDTTPPVTTAAVSPGPNPNGWNNSDVTVTLNSTDDEPGGTGVKQVAYSATGAEPLASTLVPGASASITLSVEGITTITFFSTDNVGNVETAKTITIKLDKTSPTITGSRMPGPNPNGWNNTSITVSFQCADTLSGLAPGSPPAPTILSSEGAAQSVTGICNDLAGNAAAAKLENINIDLTPPVLTPSVNPPPNANGWENTDTTVTWSAVDPLSGVAVVSGPVTLSTDGAGQVVRGDASDLAGNVAAGSVTVNLDKTPPEAFLQFDPVARDVALFGRDSLSGVPPGPIAPVSVVKIQHDHDDDDVDHSEDDDSRSELRTYKVLDLAGNSLTLIAKVRKSRHNMSAKLVSLQYGEGAVISLPRNQEIFEWTTRDDGTLSELEQEFKAGPGEESQRVRANFDGRRDETIVVQQEPEPRTRTLKPGLDLVRIATSTGKLLIEF